MGDINKGFITPVTHILFDMDGLLLNTEDLYTIAFQNILSRFGKTYLWELKQKLMGSQSHETAKTIIEELELPLTIDEFLVESNAQFQALFPDCQLLPGAKKLIEHLHKHKIPIGLATSSRKDSYELKTNKHHQCFFELFPYKTFGSSDPEVKRGKPHPDIFLVAADKFPEKPAAEKVLVFEDSLNGVKAAKAAGMPVVMVPDERLDKVFTKEATLCLDSLLQFKPEVFGLPAYDD